jgi:hypothetical protein
MSCSAICPDLPQRLGRLGGRRASTTVVVTKSSNTFGRSNRKPLDATDPALCPGDVAAQMISPGNGLGLQGERELPVGVGHGAEALEESSQV